MSDQPTADVEDSDVWHDANSYYGDEMTSAARQRAERAIDTLLHDGEFKDAAARVLRNELRVLRESEAEWQRRGDRAILAEAVLKDTAVKLGQAERRAAAAEARVVELEKIAGQERAARKALSIELQNANEDYEKLSREKT